MTKYQLYKPLKILETIEFIDIIYKKVFSICNFLLITINDCDNQMISMLWKKLIKK